MRHGSCELGHRGVGRQRLNLRDDRGQGERHIRTGVTVGHREDVELVDLLAALLDGASGNDKAVAYGLLDHQTSPIDTLAGLYASRTFIASTWTIT